MGWSNQDSGGWSGSGGTSSLDAATVAWVAAVVAAGGTVSGGQQTNVNNLITSLKTHSIFTKLDRLWLYASENVQQATIDLVALDTNSPGTTSFAANRGYTGNSGAQVDLFFNAFTAAGNYAQNSSHIMLWNNGSNGTGSQVALTTTTTATIYAFLSGTTSYFHIQDSTGAGVADANGLGFYIANRSGASAWQGYKNGSSITSGTDASVALANDVWTTPASGAGGDGASTDQISAVGFGGSLSSTDVSNYNSAMRTYMTAVGVP